MKRLLIATLALTTILTACSDDNEPTAETDGDTALVSETTSESKEANLAEAEAEQEGQSLEELRESLSKFDEVSKEMSDELNEAIDNASVRTFEMSDVIIKVMGVERSEFAHGTLIDVEYAVENTVKERRMVPLERTIIVTNDGTQVEYDRDVSNLPEWDLVSDTKTEGTVSFYLKDVEPSEVDSVDVIVPGVDFKRSDDELFTVYFNE